MNMNDEEILEDLTRSRGLGTKSKEGYKDIIRIYTSYFNKTLQELLSEAEDEEESGIRWKNRKLKKRLLEFRSYLSDKYLKGTAKTQFLRISAIYRHYEIEIHQLPPWNEKSMNTFAPVTYSDLPDREIIKEAINMARGVMKAMILFMSSSGTARRETLNLTLDDFITATKQYHNGGDIFDVIKELDGKEDIIPTFRLKRQKTNKHYYTFCSPESTQQIINYLKTREKLNSGKNGHKLFKISTRHMSVLFQELNEKMSLGKVGAHNRFRSHMLRKFHASQLYNDGMSLEMVDALQGRGKDSTHSSYFMEDPEKLKKEYVDHLDCLMINWNTIDYKSPEYLELENENRKKDEKIRDYESIINDIDSRLRRIEEIDNFTEKDFRELLK